MKPLSVRVPSRRVDSESPATPQPLQRKSAAPELPLFADVCESVFKRRYTLIETLGTGTFAEVRQPAPGGGGSGE